MTGNPEIEVRLYRFDRDDGTAKDWAVPTTLGPDVFTVFYGRTGAALRRAETPAARCAEGRPDREAERRRIEKLRKGYRDLGLHRLAADRRTLLQGPARPAPPAAGASAAAPSTAAPCLYWRWRPKTDARAAVAAVAAACLEARAAVAAVGWPVPAVGPKDGGVALWAVVSGNVRSGIVPLVEGRQATVAFWLLLALRVPALTLADEAGHRATAWPAALSVTDETLERLGLKPPDPRRWFAAADPGDGWFF